MVYLPMPHTELLGIMVPKEKEGRKEKKERKRRKELEFSVVQTPRLSAATLGILRQQQFRSGVKVNFWRLQIVRGQRLCHLLKSRFCLGM